MSRLFVFVCFLLLGTVIATDWVEVNGLTELTLPGPGELVYNVEPLDSQPVFDDDCDDTEPLHQLVTLRLSAGCDAEQMVVVDLTRGCDLMLSQVAPDGALYLLLGGLTRYTLLRWQPGNDTELLLKGGNFIVKTTDEQLILSRDLPCDAEAHGFSYVMPMRVDGSPPGGISLSFFQQYMILDTELDKILEPLWLVSASSYLTGGPADYSPARVIDGDINTAWVEGVEGDGIDETLTLDLGIPTEVFNVALLPGYCTSPEIWLANGRPSRVKLELSNGITIERELQDVSYTQVISLEGIHTVSWLRLTLLDVYPGERWADTAVSELTINYVEGY